MAKKGKKGSGKKEREGSGKKSGRGSKSGKGGSPFLVGFLSGLIWLGVIFVFRYEPETWTKPFLLINAALGFMCYPRFAAAALAFCAVPALAIAFGQDWAGLVFFLLYVVLGIAAAAALAGVRFVFGRVFS